MATNSPPTNAPPMAVQERRTPVAITLTAVHNLILDIIARQVRIETRLVKLLHERGLDANGDPSHN